MKKFIITSIFIFTISGLIAMEESTQSNWERLPQEVKLHILSYLPDVRNDNYEDWIQAMTVSKEFHSLLNDQQFLNAFAKRLAARYEQLQEDYPVVAGILKGEVINFLTKAAEHKNVKLTRALANADSDLKYAAGALFVSAAYDPALLDTLYEAGIDINSTLVTGANGLMKAISKDITTPSTSNIDKARWFLDHGIDLRYPYKDQSIIDFIKEQFANNKDKMDPWLELIEQAQAEREKACN